MVILTKFSYLALPIMDRMGYKYANALEIVKSDDHLTAPTIDKLQGQIRDEVMRTRAEIVKIRAMMKEVVASQTMVKYSVFLVMCLYLILLAKV